MTLQVDELKAKLAAQEVELQKKNDEADKLITIVEAETAKVSDCCSTVTVFDGANFFELKNSQSAV